MSVAVWYRSARPVPEAIRRAILDDTASLPPLPWYEPVHFTEDQRYPGHLCGWSKAPGLSYQTDDGQVRPITTEDWCFMDYRGFSALVGHLQAWSRSHGVTWIITAEESTLGRIADGKPGWWLRRYVRRAALLARASGDEATDAARASELRSRYPGLE